MQRYCAAVNSRLFCTTPPVLPSTSATLVRDLSLPADSGNVNPAFIADPDAVLVTRDQILYPASREEVAVLAQSKVLFADPQTAPDSILIRLVRLSAPVSSPVLRVVHNRQFGIRTDEWMRVLGVGLALSCLFGSLGFWQLRRMTLKKELIDLRRDRLAQPTLNVDELFSWDENNYQDFEHRQIKLTGMMDPSRELLVGPRSFAFGTSEMSTGQDALDSVGYLVITPMILPDGRQILVNRGAISLRKLKQRPLEMPELVTVRGVLVSGELSGGGEWWRLPNRPADRKFLFLNVRDLATAAQITRNFDVAKLLLVTAVAEEGDKTKRTKHVKKRTEDFLVFYADEHTHLWYAAQWFACAALLSVLSSWRAYALARRWRW